MAGDQGVRRGLSSSSRVPLSDRTNIEVAASGQKDDLIAKKRAQSRESSRRYRERQRAALQARNKDPELTPGHNDHQFDMEKNILCPDDAPSQYSETCLVYLLSGITGSIGILSTSSVVLTPVSKTIEPLSAITNVTNVTGQLRRDSATPCFIRKSDQTQCPVYTLDEGYVLPSEDIAVATPSLFTKPKLMPSVGASSKHVQMTAVSHSKCSQANVGKTTEPGVNGYQTQWPSETLDAEYDVAVATPLLCLKTKLIRSLESTLEQVETTQVGVVGESTQGGRKISQATLGETTQVGVVGKSTQGGAHFDFEDESWLRRNDDWHQNSTSDGQNLYDSCMVATQCFAPEELQRARWRANSQSFRKRKIKEQVGPSGNINMLLGKGDETHVNDLVYESGIWDPDASEPVLDEENLETHKPIDDDIDDVLADDEGRVFRLPDVQYKSYRVNRQDGGAEGRPNPYDYVYHNLPKKHHVLGHAPDCEHCGAKRFPGEGAAFCCREGMVCIHIPEIPAEMRRLFTNQTDRDAKYFRKNIRYFNSHFSFTSMGVKLDRVKRSPHLDLGLIKLIVRILQGNPYVGVFRSLGSKPNLDEYRIELNTKIDVDQRRYNAPTASQVSAIWLEGSDPKKMFERSVMARQDGMKRHCIRKKIE
ncbi:hypothetical protein EJB05_26953, partial [Eragrostis curvula]